MTTRYMPISALIRLLEAGVLVLETYFSPASPA